MKPIVGLSIADDHAEDEIYHRLKAFGINVIRFDHNGTGRWDTLNNVGWVRKRVVCVIDDDNDMVIHATDLGFHAIQWSPDHAWHFGWHLRGDRTGNVLADAVDLFACVAHLLKDWRDKTRAERRT
jgi:uncharacterized protein (DUF2235 family)